MSDTSKQNPGEARMVAESLQHAQTVKKQKNLHCDCLCNVYAPKN